VLGALQAFRQLTTALAQAAGAADPDAPSEVEPPPRSPNAVTLHPVLLNAFLNIVCDCASAQWLVLLDTDGLSAVLTALYQAFRLNTPRKGTVYSVCDRE